MQPHPGQPVYPPPPPKPKSILPLIIVVCATVALLLCGGLVALALTDSTADKPTTTPTSRGPLSNDGVGTRPGHTIRFEVTTKSGTATIINWSTIEDSALLTDQKTPWSLDVVMDRKLGSVGVNASAGEGTVSCKVFMDGVLLDEGESEGAVNCSGSVR